MVDLTEAARRYAEVCERWDAKFAEARAARIGLTSDFMACAHGRGTGPLLQNVQRTEKLEAEAEQLKAEMNRILRETFG